MRIALIHLRHAEVGGTERFMNRIAAHLAGLGHEVAIVCRRHGALPHPRVRFVVLHGLAVGGAWRAWRFAQDVEAHVREARYDLVFALGKTWTHDVIRSGGGCHQTYLDTADRHARGAWERATGWGALKNRVALDIEAKAYAPGAYRKVIAIS
ncbi:MAG TPA: glycosyltransferase, partial [Planctomycetota bacterium]|nr:glycosyltransferase [Planctomycetota bacterium]